MKKVSSLKHAKKTKVDRKRLRSRKRRIVRRLEKKGLLEKQYRTNAKLYSNFGASPVGSLARRPIFLPKVLSFWKNYEDTARALADIREFGLAKRIPLILHFGEVEEIDPSAALALVSEIYRCQNLRAYRNEDFVIGNYPDDKIVHRQLADMGFFELLKIKDNLPKIESHERDASKPIYLKFVTRRRIDGAFVTWFVSIIEKYVLGLNPVARGKLVGAIKEAMGNTFEHAYKIPTKYQPMKHRWFLSSSLNVSTHEVKVVLYDQGVGIPKTLEKGLVESVLRALKGVFSFKNLTPTDGEIVKVATEIWRTGTSQSGRGKGFRDMKRFVDSCKDGELRILSNRGKYTYMNKTEVFDDESISAGGTVIEWRFRNDEAVNMEDD